MTRRETSGLAIITFLLFMTWLVNEYTLLISPSASSSVGAQPVYYGPGKVQGASPQVKAPAATGKPAPPGPRYFAPGEPQVKAPGATRNPARPGPSYIVPTEGSVVRLYSEGPGVTVGTDEQAQGELLDLARVGDSYGIRLLVQSGRIAVVDNGTRARVLDIGFFFHEVRILEGDYAGVRGWVPKEFVRR